METEKGRTLREQVLQVSDDTSRKQNKSDKMIRILCTVKICKNDGNIKRKLCDVMMQPERGATLENSVIQVSENTP